MPELAAAIAKFFGKAADGAALREMDEEDMAELAEDHLEPLAVRPPSGFWEGNEALEILFEYASVGVLVRRALAP